MKKTIISIASALLLLTSAFAQEVMPFRNPELSREERINDLLARLTLQEKVGMMMHGSKGVERLGIPDYNWWNEALHGVARAGAATVFPQAIGMAATFNPDLIYSVADAVSTEARAKYNKSVQFDDRDIYKGLIGGNNPTIFFEIRKIAECLHRFE